MQNRIIQHFSDGSTTVQLEYRPTLTLTMERPFKVDMENFFELSFSFAEALLDLEDKYAFEPQIMSLDRALPKAMVCDESQLDIDARWM